MARLLGDMCLSGTGSFVPSSVAARRSHLLTSPSAGSKAVCRQRRECRTFAMKKDIHPEFYEDAKVYCNGEEVLTVSGTKKEYTVDVWSGNHPFYTGSNQALIVDEGRVSKFQKRFQGLTIGQVAPVSAGGNKKLEYKVEKDKGKKGKGKR